MGKNNLGRQTQEIRVWFVRNDLLQADIAKQLGVSRSLITHVIHGRRQSKRVLAKLLEVGVPKKLLGRLPELKAAA